MRLLSIETSGYMWSIAAQENKKLLATCIHSSPQKAASLLIPLVQQMLQGISLVLSDFDGIAVARGPGSFTGIRVGLSTAHGLSLALQCPLFALNNFDIIYGTICKETRSKKSFYVLLDTRGSILGLQYFPPFPEKPHSPFYGTAEEVAQILPGENESIIGDGAERLAPFLKGKKIFLETEIQVNRATSLGEEIFNRYPDPLLLDFSPIYGENPSFKLLRD